MGHKLDKRTGGIILLAIVAVVIIIILRSCGGRTAPTTSETEPSKSTLDFTPAGERQENSIIIPGMTGINMNAGQLQQSVDFYNPESNECYFVLSLYLSDDTLIYQSGFIEPGENITEIMLSQMLERGIYGKCRLVYDCYSLNEKCPLNSGEVVLEINATQ